MTSIIDQEQLINALRSRSAFWQRPGVLASEPHVKLTSGKCSDAYVSMSQAFSYPNLLTLFAEELIRRWRLNLHEQGRVAQAPDWVMGSAQAGIKLAAEIGRLLSSLFDEEVRTGYTEKGPNNTQVLKRFDIKRGETILHVEDLNTTLGTIKRHRQAVHEATNGTAIFFPCVLVGVNRGPDKELDEKTPLISTVSIDTNVWEPDECPLCKAGSEPLKPKSNWQKLNA